MINKIAALFILCFGFHFTFGQSSCIDNYTETQVIAKKQNKKILLYFSGSDWCKPCMMLKKNILQEASFIKAIEDKYIVFNIDFPQNQKRISAKEIKCREKMAAKYNPRGIFPKLVLINQENKILKEMNGYSRETPKEIISLLVN